MSIPFPSCMMPDGAEPCEAFLELQAEVERLRAERNLLREMFNSAEKELAAEREQLHYANGTCDLAIKQRNIAEEALAAERERCARVVLRELSPELGEEIAAEIRKTADEPASH